jgi:hypothetical protein
MVEEPRDPIVPAKVFGAEERAPPMTVPPIAPRPMIPPLALGDLMGMGGPLADDIDEVGDESAVMEVMGIPLDCEFPILMLL